MKANFIDDFLKEITKDLGGPGSGNHGHVGRPGKVGGSAPDNSDDYSYEEDDDYHIHEKYARRWLQASDYEAKEIAREILQNNKKLHQSFLKATFGDDYPNEVVLYRVGRQNEGLISLWTNESSAKAYQKRMDVDTIYSYRVKTEDIYPSGPGAKEVWVDDWKLEN